jgi:hypothetical protein
MTTMTRNAESGSAKIYQFPARGRFAANSHAREGAKLTVLDAPSIAFGSGWYHDEAIEAERARKN